MLVEDARTPDELAPAFDRLAKARAEVVIVPPNGMFINQRKMIVQLAIAARVCRRSFQEQQDVKAGGFLETPAASMTPRIPYRRGRVCR